MSSENLRLASLQAFIVIALLSLIIRLVYLQIYRHEYYEAVATSQRQRAADLSPNRGNIYLQESNGTELFPVAVNNEAWIAYAVPRQIDDPRAAAEKLAPALLDYRERQQVRVNETIKLTGQDKARAEPAEPPEAEAESDEPTADRELTRAEKLAQVNEELYFKLNRRSDPYEPILRFYEILDDPLREFLTHENIAGIVLEEQKIRTYPENTLASHVIGYLGWENDRQTGRYGIEGYYENDLKGDLGFLSAERDATGKHIGVGSREFRPAEDGADIILTIDRVVQSIIEDELADGVNRYGAERGSVLVMDPASGSILGMATYPGFDPNYYYAIKDPRVQLNPIISDLFEPGSILKPVVMAAAINEALVTPHTTMVDNGPVKVDKYTINTFDGKHHGVQTMTELLEQSNNVGMVWVGNKLQPEKMYDYFRGFGLGEKTGIELEGETNNSVLKPSDWNIATLATASFGQGIAMTPLQALNSINAIANDGILMRPYLTERVRYPDGREEVTEPAAVRQAITSRTAADVSAMMVSVLENGVATLARVPGYYLAGKTGTAQVPDEKGAYSADKKIISFVGFGPLNKPRFSILIKLDNPSGLSFASGTAAPMFRNISGKLLNYYQIPPDYDPATRPKPYSVPANSLNPDA